MIRLVDIDHESGCTDLAVAEDQQDFVCNSLATPQVPSPGVQYL